MLVFMGIHKNVARHVCYVYTLAMDEIISQLRTQRAKAQVKVERAQRALETAKSELSDVEAALRVLGGLTSPSAAALASSSNNPATPQVAKRQEELLGVLPDDDASAAEPKDLFVVYEMCSTDVITIDTFRTTLWRMKSRGPFEYKGGLWEVRSADGRYWKERTDGRDLA